MAGMGHYRNNNKKYSFNCSKYPFRISLISSLYFVNSVVRSFLNSDLLSLAINSWSKVQDGFCNNIGNTRNADINIDFVVFAYFIFFSASLSSKSKKFTSAFRQSSKNCFSSVAFSSASAFEGISSKFSTNLLISSFSPR